MSPKQKVLDCIRRNSVSLATYVACYRSGLTPSADQKILPPYCAHAVPFLQAESFGRYKIWFNRKYIDPGNAVFPESPKLLLMTNEVGIMAAIDYDGMVTTSEFHHLQLHNAEYLLPVTAALNSSIANWWWFSMFGSAADVNTWKIISNIPIPKLKIENMTEVHSRINKLSSEIAGIYRDLQFETLRFAIYEKRCHMEAMAAEVNQLIGHSYGLSADDLAFIEEDTFRNLFV